MGMNKIELILDSASLDFPIYTGNARSLKSTILNLSTGGKISRDTSRLIVEALKDVSFQLQEGDRVGLVGHNGAGKTTLLRMLSGIYEPTRGRATIRGRVSSLLDVTIGVEPLATGYENIIMSGLYLGLSYKEIRAQQEEITEFSELGDYLALHVRTYSSGMLMRLAFSVATNVRPEILLMDEWIAAGDAQFLDKAEQRLNEMIERSKIFVFASHSKDLIKRLCNKLIVLDHGHLKAIGPIDEVEW